jgi:hypothetical protein
MLRLNLSGISSTGEEGTPASSARRVAPTPRDVKGFEPDETSDSSDLDSASCGDSCTYSSDDSLDNLDLLDLEESTSEDLSEVDLSPGEDETSSCGLSEDDNVGSGDNGDSGINMKDMMIQKHRLTRPPRLTLPSLSVLPLMDVTKATLQGNSTSKGLPVAPSRTDGNQLIKVDLLTPCFDLSVAEADDAPVLIAEKFGVRQDRVKIIMRAPESTRVGVELVGSSFSLEKLEEALKQNAALNARVTELERKLTNSESHRLRTHQALQELRKEIDLLDKFILKK